MKHKLFVAALAVVFSLVGSVAYVFAQQLPTTGNTLGQGKVSVGQSTEGRFREGKSMFIFAGIGIGEQADLFIASGHDHGHWAGIGVSATDKWGESFSFSLSALVRVGKGYGITPRLLLTEKLSPKFEVFAGTSYYMTADNLGNSGWEALYGGRLKIDEKLTLLAEMSYGRAAGVRVAIAYDLGKFVRQ